MTPSVHPPCSTQCSERSPALRGKYPRQCLQTPAGVERAIRSNGARHIPPAAMILAIALSERTEGGQDPACPGNGVAAPALMESEIRVPRTIAVMVSSAARSSAFGRFQRQSQRAFAPIKQLAQIIAGWRFLYQGPCFAPGSSPVPVTTFKPATQLRVHLP